MVGGGEGERAAWRVLLSYSNTVTHDDPERAQNLYRKYGRLGFYIPYTPLENCGDFNIMLYQVSSNLIAFKLKLKNHLTLKWERKALRKEQR